MTPSGCFFRSGGGFGIGFDICFILLFERSEFLIDTSQKKSLRVCTCARVHACSTNLGFSVWNYVPHTYVPGISSLSARYQDTYMYLRMCQGGVRIMCHICS